MKVFFVRTADDEVFEVRAYDVWFEDAGWVKFTDCPRDPKNACSGNVLCAFPEGNVKFIWREGNEPTLQSVLKEDGG